MLEYACLFSCPVPSPIALIGIGNGAKGQGVLFAPQTSHQKREKYFIGKYHVKEAIFTSLQLIAFIKVTRKYEQNCRKIQPGLCSKAMKHSCIMCLYVNIIYLWLI